MEDMPIVQCLCTTSIGDHTCCVRVRQLQTGRVQQFHKTPISNYHKIGSATMLLSNIR